MTRPEGFAGVVIVAAGRGERFGDAGKVLAPAAGRPLLCWSVEAALRATVVAEIVVVAGSHNLQLVEELVLGQHPDRTIRVCVGGERRQDSVMAGMDALSDLVDVAIIHDAARPLATAAMFDAVAIAALETGAAITSVPVIDTIKEIAGDTILRTIDRASLRAAQTPQAYRRELLEEAFASARHLDYTDEAALLEALGHPVRIIDGSSTNLKVTVPEDLDLVGVLLAKRSHGVADVST